MRCQALVAIHIVKFPRKVLVLLTSIIRGEMNICLFPHNLFLCPTSKLISSNPPKSFRGAEKIILVRLSQRSVVTWVPLLLFGPRARIPNCREPTPLYHRTLPHNSNGPRIMCRQSQNRIQEAGRSIRNVSNMSRTGSIPDHSSVACTYKGKQVERWAFRPTIPSVCLPHP